jgi:hypothetical protein
MNQFLTIKNKVLIFLTASFSYGFSQTYTLPIDFETLVIVGAFDNAVGSVVTNPSSIGNTSANVGKLVRPTGLTSNYAGSRIMLTAPLNYSSTPFLAVKVYSTQAIGYNIICKFEGGTPYEASAVTTKSGEWETLYFNFTGVNSGTNNQMLFMFNAGAPGNGEEYFFDDIELVASIPNSSVVALPIDFETPVPLGAFDNAVGEIVSNPFQIGINTSDKVGKLTRPFGTSDWAGSRITLTSPIDFSSNPFLTMKVYCTEPIGHLVKVKFEGGVPFERDAYTTKIGEWETLTFDFTGQVLGGNNQMLFMFNGGIAGSGQIYYFDDIQQFEELPSLSITSSSPNNSACIGETIILTSSVASGNQWNIDGNPISGATNSTFSATVNGSYSVTAEGSTSSAIVLTFNECSGAGIDEASKNNLVVYPNPSNGNFIVKADNLKEFSSIELLDQIGRTVGSWKVDNSVMNITSKNLAKGSYNLVINGQNGFMIQKLQID